MEIGLNWLGSSCREPYALSLDLRVQTIFRKMAKVLENLTENYQLRSVFIAAWPELYQFNCGNLFVCLELSFTCKNTKSTYFLCLLVRDKDNRTKRSISSEILVMIGSGRFRILNWNERNNFWRRELVFDYKKLSEFLCESQILFLLKTQNEKV